MFSQRQNRERREQVICSGLVTKLKEAVQSVLQSGGTRDESNSVRSPVLGHSDNTNALCNALEAILIHGLRDSFGTRMTSFLTDTDRMPVPNFWPVILIESHRDIIEQVGSLSFITCEVGRSRAWLRLALNQGQICSYLAILANDTRTLKEYYKPHSFLRDPEQADIMLCVLQPISALTFNLATNAAVLNTWTQSPLVLAGLWAPCSEQGGAFDPVLSATDVASTVYDENSGYVNIPVHDTTPISDQMFDMIIGGTPETSFITEVMETRNAPQESNIAEVNEDIKVELETTKDNNVDNLYENDKAQSKKEKLAMHVHLEDESKEKESCKNSEILVEESPLDSSIDSSFTSYISSPNFENQNFSHSISVESTMSNSINESAPDYEKLFTNIDVSANLSIPNIGLTVDNNHHRVTVIVPEETLEESPSSDEAEKLNYEVLPNQRPTAEVKAHLHPLLTRITTEEGLDAQNYQCENCGAYIGMVYGKARVCNYDRKYYCYECHEGEVAVIPSKILHNWDLCQYPVCGNNAQWLSDVYHQPLIDVRTANPKIYSHIDDMAEMQMLRTQLLYIQAYILTCRSGVGERLKKMLWPREHLYEHVHLYSTFDLESVASGQLVSLVKSAVTWGRDHITQCIICAPRGFICEMCDDATILYPFQLGITNTCPDCHAVSHAVCARVREDCPRCLRRKARREIIC